MRGFTLVAALLIAPGVLANEPVELTFIANEGVLIRSGDQAVAIDAPGSNSYDGTYALPSAMMLDAMTSGGYPVGSLNAILFTHIHGDHFDAQGAAAIVAGNPGTPTIMASGQVIEAFIASGGDELDAELLEPVEVYCEAEPADECPDYEDLIVTFYGFEVERPYNPDDYDWSGVDIDARPLFHVEGVDHWSFRVELNGVSILHLGDTQPQRADFSVWDGVMFDVILYPYWFLQMAEGVTFLDAHPEARAIAFHIPAAATPAQISELLGGREYFHTEGETILLREAAE